MRINVPIRDLMQKVKKTWRDYINSHRPNIEKLGLMTHLLALLPEKVSVQWHI